MITIHKGHAMRTSWKLFLLPLLILPAVALTSCGGNPTPPASTPYTGLTGNWALAGDRATSTYPAISAALTLNGNQINAIANIAVPCARLLDPLVSILNVPVALTGTLASDGTFTLTEPPLPVQLPLQVTLQGNSQTTGWGGTYAIASTAALTGCTIVSPSNGSFTAKAIPPLNGTYIGSATFFSSPGGNLYAATVNAQLTQGGANGSPGSTGYFPLSGTITVQSVPCFTHGATAANATTGEISGDFFTVQFTMDDGSTLLMGGEMTDFTGATLQATYIVSGGNCNGMIGNGSAVLH